MSAIVYRSADAGDLEDVAKLWGKLDQFHRGLGLAFPAIEGVEDKWLSSFERTLGRFSFLWIAEYDNQIEAFLLGRVKQSPGYLAGVQVGEISDLFVSEQVRGKQVGEKLVALAMEKFAELSMHSVEVQIQAGNAGGMEFWKNQGFDLDLTQVRKTL